VRRGVGTVVLDIRRGDGPAGAFDYTLPVVATTDRLIQNSPGTVAAMISAVVGSHAALRKDVSLATEIGCKLFPAMEAGLITELITRDLRFYDASLSPRCAPLVYSAHPEAPHVRLWP
jgi:NitT/TauT family transport system substrate-binding protein